MMTAHLPRWAMSKSSPAIVTAEMPSVGVPLSEATNCL